MPTKKHHGPTTAPSADDANLDELEAEALDGDTDPDDVLDDDDDAQGEAAGDVDPLQAELDALEEENRASLDKADPPTDEPAAPPPAPPAVDPAEERARVLSLLLPEVKQRYGHLEVKSVGRSSITVPLTQDEKIALADRISGIRDRLAAHERREERIKAALKGARAALETEEEQAWDEYRKGAEERVLHVAIFLDFVQNRAVTVRQDTAEIVAERALSYEERQTMLFAPPVEVKDERRA